jgi:tripartite-type tricarboxylate transporter receptor subunit TctC
VTPISSTPNVLVISPAKNIKTLQELLAAARAKPGSMNFASAGQGSATHLNAEKFKLAAKIDASNIPFKGSAEAVTEVIGRPCRLLLLAHRAGDRPDQERPARAARCRLAQAFQRLAAVPTTAEAGVPGSEFNFWIGMMAPAKTPREIVNRLHDEVEKALATPEVKERFATLGADAWTLKPEQFDAYIKDEIKTNAVLVKAAGLEVHKQ